MALIHERLYKSKDISTIDFGQYIKELAGDIFYSFGIEDDRVRLAINSHNIYLGIETAIPCGLIINELVSNALKHAFVGNMSGEIRIDISDKGDNDFMLMVSDNGVGIPKDMDIHNNAASLGLQLVCTLTGQ
ncbi:signal transduction histidine kinase, partial [Candidatus Magnetobacterium bavaricum]